MNPDVIVLDVRLPDGNGSDVVLAFGSRGSLSHTPIVVYSGIDLDTNKSNDLQLGATVILSKERTTPEELRSEVLALVGAVTGHDTTHEGGSDGSDTD
jgi:CheY-like chemotaxis protein